MEEQPMHEIRTAEPARYAEFLAELRQRIERAQLRAFPSCPVMSKHDFDIILSLA